jgi:hypothetical protein
MMASSRSRPGFSRSEPFSMKAHAPSCTSFGPLFWDRLERTTTILGMGRLSKFDYFSRSLADIFVSAPDLTPCDPIIPTQDLNEKNPQNTAAARMSEGLDLSAPDRVDDHLYNRILWLRLKGDIPPPVARSHAALHALQSSK